jgi:hypothetical protein
MMTLVNEFFETYMLSHLYFAHNLLVLYNLNSLSENARQ